MALQVAVVMDPIGAIKIAKDTSFAMLLEAQRRGHHLHYVAPGSLGVADGRAVARLTPLTVARAPDHLVCAGRRRHPAAGRDGRDPDAHRSAGRRRTTCTTRIILGMAQADGVLVVNDPRGLRDLNEKLAALLFPQCCPPTLVTREAALLRAFIAEHGHCVLKPLDGMGGRSIFQIRDGDPNPT